MNDNQFSCWVSTPFFNKTAYIEKSQISDVKFTKSLLVKLALDIYSLKNEKKETLFNRNKRINDQAFSKSIFFLINQN